MMIRSLWITLCLVVSLPVLGNENLLTERYNLTYLDLGNGAATLQQHEDGL